MVNDLYTLQSMSVSPTNQSPSASPTSVDPENDGLGSKRSPEAMLSRQNSICSLFTSINDRMSARASGSSPSSHLCPSPDWSQASPPEPLSAALPPGKTCEHGASRNAARSGPVSLDGPSSSATAASNASLRIFARCTPLSTSCASIGSKATPCAADEDRTSKPSIATRARMSTAVPTRTASTLSNGPTTSGLSTISTSPSASATACAPADPPRTADRGGEIPSRYARTGEPGSSKCPVSVTHYLP